MASIVEQAILALCRRNPDGLSDKELEKELSHIPVLDRANAINSLLQKRMLQLFKHGDSLIYRELDHEEAVKFKGLASEDMLVYQVIQQSGNMGIWTRDLKMKSNLQQPQITKILKTLESRKLVKAVKSVVSKNRKVYMLYELEPSKEITGGAWYTEHEFDAEFIAVLRQQSLDIVLREAMVSLETIAEYVRRTGVTKVDLRYEDYLQVVDTLVYDGEIDAVISSGVGKDAKFPAGSVYYRPSKEKVPESSAFTNIPCGVCPVMALCTDNGIISPKTCLYYQQWLQF
eukprot:TRINITY_DN19670_c0_g1_i1.p1 TRINITY_DN19670_c0_g1~~TRINITY_DN19670_c0_g1_i1.p1  ORF type:complete len:316 (-),score=71.55 TRINITY_DN19670_c0_g1_i1:238-1098(-)